jgi:cytochrome P450
MGKHQCPGCFFAGSELKLCLADIILQYNIRLKEGYSPQVMQNGFMTISDPFAQVQVRRR